LYTKKFIQKMLRYFFLSLKWFTNKFYHRYKCECTPAPRKKTHI